jgi:hypothetical protein
MNRCPTLTLCTLALVCLALSGAAAQTAPPTYQGDPDVYKVIFEDQNYRVIETTRKKGVHDKMHGHPVPSVVYHVTDCSTKLYAADGKTTENRFATMRAARREVAELALSRFDALSVSLLAFYPAHLGFGSNRDGYVTSACFRPSSESGAAADMARASARSTLQLPLELIEEAQVGALRDDLVRG